MATLSLPLILIILSAISAILCFVIVIQAVKLVRRSRVIEQLRGQNLALREKAILGDTVDKKNQELLQTVIELREECARLKAEMQQKQINFAEKEQNLLDIKKNLTDSLGNLSLEALKKNSQMFMELAQSNFSKEQSKAQSMLQDKHNAIANLVRPIEEKLSGVDKALNALEKERVGAYSSLKQQMQELAQHHLSLRMETSNLVQALRSSNVRGRWGELQLKRVVELAGMVPHCDFYEQQSNQAEEKGRARPDLIIHLPGDKIIIVDAKAPLSAYLDAMDGAKNPEEKIVKLKEHAGQVRQHIMQLSKKNYWEHFNQTPDFVVMFLPGESFFSAALEQDPSLIEFAMLEKVVIATPTTLITMLKAIAYGWQQDSLAQNAKEIGNLGQELYKRIAHLNATMGKLGRSLNQSVATYNQAIGTLESRVLVSARKFEDLKTVSPHKDIEENAPLELQARPLLK